jgi:predicted phosphodiesterase
MTKISLCSDLHLEFCQAPELPGGDILILAGDIFQVSLLAPHRTDKEARKARDRAVKFCTEQLRKYHAVFYVTGNHEYYSSLIETADQSLREFLRQYAPNVRFLDNSIDHMDGVTFIGSTLWARSCAGTAEEWRAARAMNDFSRIKTSAEPPEGMRLYHKQRAFQPVDANRLYQINRQFITDAAAAINGPIILITHHAPCFASGHGVDFNAAYLDDVYCGDLVDILFEHPHIKYAVHGHTHCAENYKVGETRVLSNPRGYFPDERISRHFDPEQFSFELEDLKNG